MKRMDSGIMLILLIGMLVLALDTQSVKASRTIYIKPDGSVDGTDKIQRIGDMYIFTDNIYDSIVVQRNNIAIDGAGYTLQGTGAFLSSGMSLEGISNITIKNMEIKVFDCGIYFNRSSENSVIGNNITANNFGLFLDKESSNNCIKGNSIASNSHTGIELGGGSNNTVYGNNITNNNAGVYHASSSNNTVSRNSITNNEWGGIYLGGYSNNNTISWNNITDSYNGIMLDETPSNNTILKNNITNNENGIDLFWFSNNNSVVGNNITNNNVGLSLGESSSNTIVENNITNNWHGVELFEFSNNSFYHNNFVNNTLQVYDYSWDYPYAPSINTWDYGYPSGGNYWSDHTGPDLFYGPFQNLPGSDGIVDTPYIIDADNKDNYPLMSPYEYWINPIPGDINRDTKVDYTDLFMLAKAYGSKPGDPHWNPNADLNGDNKVDYLDLYILAKHYGQET